MGRITINVSSYSNITIPIGRAGENSVTAVDWNFSTWKAEYGDGVVSLAIRRKTDAVPYPVILTVSENIATWDISDVDTAVPGKGEAQFTYTVGEKVKKSAIYALNCYVSLGTNGPVPEPYEDWLAQVEAYAKRAEDAAERAESAEGGGVAVQSVNGKTGAVVLNASDVGALPAETQIPTVTNDFTDTDKSHLNTLWEDYQTAMSAFGDNTLRNDYQTALAAFERR